MNRRKRFGAQKSESKDAYLGKKGEKARETRVTRYKQGVLHVHQANLAIHHRPPTRVISIRIEKDREASGGSGWLKCSLIGCMAKEEVHQLGQGQGLSKINR